METLPCIFKLLKRKLKVKFNDKFEFGYGEDSDFGMQIRNQGCDILYFPNPEIVHLKAPSGGFRIKPTLAWSNDPVMPKPSPTIMLYKILHETKEQRNGYRETGKRCAGQVAADFER